MNFVLTGPASSSFLWKPRPFYLTSPWPRLLPVSCVPRRQQCLKPLDADREPRDWKSKGSSQLSHWSRARSIRSGRRIDQKPSQGSEILAAAARPEDASSPDALASLLLQSDGEEEREGTSGGKLIYVVSEGTGWTAEDRVNNVLGQFEHCLVDRRCRVQTHLFSGVDDEERMLEIIKQAARKDALVIYSLLDPNMAKSAKQACQQWEVPCVSILGLTTQAITAHIGFSPSGIPCGKAPLTREEFRRFEAINFTIKQDDGALPKNLHLADIVLIGVSRTSKTPLSIYLARKGYKVANVPVVMGVSLPKYLFEVDHDKIFGLTINPAVLQTIRKARVKALGFGSGEQTNYAEMVHVKEELDHCSCLFAQNPRWPVIEVTGKAIEEIATVVVKIYHDRKHKCWMPTISKRY